MSDIFAVYEKLLKSNEGDILVKLKDGKQLKIISHLIKNRSVIFKTMLESPMQEAATGVVDLSAQYSIEAFREFMAYIYYDKSYTGSYLPLLFEILSIANYYEVDAYKDLITNRIIALITHVPICLMIAYEALKHVTLTENIYHKCISLLSEACRTSGGIGLGAINVIDPDRRICYDVHSGDTMAWCCSDHSPKTKIYPRPYIYHSLKVNGQVACIDVTTRKGFGERVGDAVTYTKRCCIHRVSQPVLLSVDQLPDFIVNDVRLALNGHKGRKKDQSG